MRSNGGISLFGQAGRRKRSAFALTPQPFGPSWFGKQRGEVATRRKVMKDEPQMDPKRERHFCGRSLGHSIPYFWKDPSPLNRLPVDRTNQYNMSLGLKHFETIPKQRQLFVFETNSPSFFPSKPQKRNERLRRFATSVGCSKRILRWGLLADEQCGGVGSGFG